MIYIASPYSSPERGVMEHRLLLVEEYTASLLKQKILCFSPIVHCHEMAKRHKLPTDFAFWKWYNYSMMDIASDLHVLILPGWEDSVGVAGEITYWNHRNFMKPCMYVAP